MKRIAIIYISLLLSFASFAQQGAGNSAPFLSKQHPDSLSHGSFFLSMDGKGKTLFIPASTDSLKIYGIKIFNDDGEQLISKKISDSSKVTAIDISKLPDGDYIVHLISAEQAIYRTKFSIRR